MAQQPTQAQQSAIRQSCRADFQSHCTGVSPGGQAALSCLQANVSTLSPACQQAVGALGGGAAAAAAPTTAPPSAMAPPAITPAPAAPPGAYRPPAARPVPVQPVRLACRADFLTYCRGIRPGAGAEIACLRRNGPNLSPGCQQSLLHMRSAMGR